jgi:hypothetical protein
VLNKMNPGAPVNNVTSAAFGRIASQAGSPRRIMIAAKLNF